MKEQFNQIKQRAFQIKENFFPPTDLEVSLRRVKLQKALQENKDGKYTIASLNESESTLQKQVNEERIKSVLATSFLAFIGAGAAYLIVPSEMREPVDQFAKNSLNRLESLKTGNDFVGIENNEFFNRDGIHTTEPSKEDIQKVAELIGRSEDEFSVARIIQNGYIPDQSELEEYKNIALKQAKENGRNVDPNKVKIVPIEVSESDEYRKRDGTKIKFSSHALIKLKN